MKTAEIIDTLSAELSKQNREIARLKSALQEYGDHTYECEMKERAGSCTCGYSEALGLSPDQ